MQQEQQAQNDPSHSSPTPIFPLPSADPRTLHPYKVPEYLYPISSHAPKHRLHLCMRPTPIHPFPIFEYNKSTTLYLKRDDMTHTAASGNKIRKLEFLLAHAISTNHNAILTAGGVQSNHTRSVTVLCRSLQLEPHIFLRSNESTDPEKLGNNGNVLFHKLLSANVYLVRRMQYLPGLLPRMIELKEKLEEENDEQKRKKAYIIGIGGSDEIGVWGYIDAFNELLQQRVIEQGFTHIALSTGSGGTIAGLSIANYLHGGHLKIVGFTVSDDANYFYDHVDEMLTHVQLNTVVNARDIMQIIEAKGGGYGVNTDDDMKKCVDIASKTGVILDPTYTLKGVLGVLKEVETKESDGVFPKGSKILFIHTGGLFGLFDRRIEPFLDHSVASRWIDKEK